VRISSKDHENRIEILARQIAGETANTETLTWARVAAEAELEKQRVAQYRVAIYERIVVFGSFDGPKFFQSGQEELRWIRINMKWLTDRGPLKEPYPDVIDPLATMPQEEPARSAEAARRLLSELVSLLRYEERAAGRRDRAIRKMILTLKSRSSKGGPTERNKSTAG
jgi:hypothetical protein